MSVKGVLMAAGLSKRMGCNKLLLKIENKYIYEYIIDSMIESDLEEILIVTNTERIIRYIKKIKKKQINHIKNPFNYKGQHESIRLGAQYYQESQDGIMFFVADQPFLRPIIINQLIKAYEKNNRIIVPYVDQQPKNPVIFPPYLKKELRSLKNNERGKTIMKKFSSEIKYINFSSTKDFFDIDTFEDYYRLLKEEG